MDHIKLLESLFNLDEDCCDDPIEDEFDEDLDLDEDTGDAVKKEKDKYGREYYGTDDGDYDSNLRHLGQTVKPKSDMAQTTLTGNATWVNDKQDDYKILVPDFLRGIGEDSAAAEFEQNCRYPDVSLIQLLRALECGVSYERFTGRSLPDTAHLMEDPVTAVLVREFFANPNHPEELHPEWLTAHINRTAGLKGL